MAPPLLGPPESGLIAKSRGEVSVVVSRGDCAIGEWCRASVTVAGNSVSGPLSGSQWQAEVQTPRESGGSRARAQFEVHVCNGEYRSQFAWGAQVIIYDWRRKCRGLSATKQFRVLEAESCPPSHPTRLVEVTLHLPEYICSMSRKYSFLNPQTAIQVRSKWHKENLARS